MDSSVFLDNVSMHFDDFVAVQRTKLKIESGEFFSFLGPSGCGKTTLLNMISGFLQPSEGVISIGGKDMSHVPANKRPTSMIFQNLALFPLMSVAENIEFGLEVRGVKKAQRAAVSKRLLELVALPDCAQKRISDLSGGQKQRIAIARALAVEPRVLLLDEPLSALDLKLRQHMRSELKDIQRKTGITFIYITHDQGEALTMSDRVAVMSAGKLEQIADPVTLYREPSSTFVASFVGENNRIEGHVVQQHGDQVDVDCGAMGHFSALSTQRHAVGSPVALYVRPERLMRLDLSNSVAGVSATAENTLKLQVQAVNFEGAYMMLKGHCINSETLLQAQVLNDAQLQRLQAGDHIDIGFMTQDARVLAVT